VELFHAISSPVFQDLQPLTGTSLADLRRESLDMLQKRLEASAERADARDVTVNCHVTWDYPPHEAIVRRASRTGADLIIAEYHDGSRLKPWLLHLTDWELLRLSPVPVLLLRDTRKYLRPAVLAAVDPSRTHEKPAKLDLEIMAAGELLADSLQGSLHAMHANYPMLTGLKLGDTVFDAGALAESYRDQKRQDSAAFRAFADKAGIPRAKRHELDGDPVYAIPKAAAATRAQIVVMGAVSRSGLKRVFIGNTAERVLNALPCDVLVVKPPRFEKKRVQKASRGMRVISATPLVSVSV
ncbi:MAG TPA: universal stress protein, partial [Steroidobacteraceae bacterium]|nr:universal stress protein [Steroidobacteraceae bacterium]